MWYMSSCGPVWHLGDENERGEKLEYVKWVEHDGETILVIQKHNEILRLQYVLIQPLTYALIKRVTYIFRGANNY